MSVAQLSTAPELSETSDDQVTNLVELGIATNEKHVAGDTINEHLFTRYPVVAKSKEDPAHVCLDLHVFDNAERVKQVHYSLLNKDVD